MNLTHSSREASGRSVPGGFHRNSGIEVYGPSDLGSALSVGDGGVRAIARLAFNGSVGDRFSGSRAGHLDRERPEFGFFSFFACWNELEGRARGLFGLNGIGGDCFGQSRRRVLRCCDLFD